MKRIIMLFAVLALVATSAFAQNGAFAPYVSGTVSTTSAMHYQNPDYKVGVGVESSTKYMLLDLNGTVGTADLYNAYLNKSAANTQFALQASGYYKFFGHLLAGGGANWSTSTASIKALKSVSEVRDSAHPFVGGGFQFGKVRTIANYNLPGKDALDNERIVNINTEIFVAKHIRVTQATTINSFVDGGKARVTGTSLGAGIKLVL